MLLCVLRVFVYLYVRSLVSMIAFGGTLREKLPSNVVEIYDVCQALGG